MKMTAVGTPMYKFRRKMTKLETIVANVDSMRKNAQEQDFYKNVPLANDTLKLLEELDDPDEGPLGKAYACNAILRELPEYDTPRLALKLLRRELSWLQESDEKSDWLHEDEVESDIARLEAYIDVDGISMEAFCKQYGRPLHFDPVERTAKWEEIYCDVEKACAKRLKGVPRGMGYCFGYWAARSNVLKEYGIDWKSPGVMNPRVMFD